MKKTARRQMIFASLALLSTVGAPAAIGGALAQDNVNLRMTVWTGNKAHLDLFNGIAEEYGKAHPNVKVTIPFRLTTIRLR
jgi:ABC-type glycerol-3-phosphate transport system substrate-binding protein